MIREDELAARVAALEDELAGAREVLDGIRATLDRFPTLLETLVPLSYRQQPGRPRLRVVDPGDD